MDGWGWVEVLTIDTILQSFQHFGIHLGLDRIRRLLAVLGNPHQQVPILHVAGTNGKGSVCAYLSSVLTQAGYRTGRYTSPHLVDWTERICVDEQLIPPEALDGLLLEIQAAIADWEDSPTQFEVITACAWLYFARQQCDIAVIEVGLGGRLDATNVCDRPLATVITSISRDHWQVLGSTLAEIAGEKAGIFKPNCPAIVGKLPLDAQTVMLERLQALNCPVIFPEPAEDLGENWAEFAGIRYLLPLNGAIQLGNSALAIATLQLLQQQGWLISEQAIQTGIKNARWMGRLQWITWRNHRFLVDGAHNPASALALRHYVDSLNPQSSHCNWVMGMLSTKDHIEIFQALLKPGDRLYLVPVPDPLTTDPKLLAEIAQKTITNLEFCQVYSDVETALTVALEDSQSLTILCGSLYLIGNFLGTIKH